jgi:hypothetical protein
MRERLASTVFGLMNNAAAISRFVIPVAASSATRRSEAVSSARVRIPLARFNSPRALSDQSGVPSSSKVANATRSVADAASRCFCRRSS